MQATAGRRPSDVAKFTWAFWAICLGHIESVLQNPGTVGGLLRNLYALPSQGGASAMPSYTG